MLSEGGMGGSYRVMSSVQWGWFSHPSGRSISHLWGSSTILGEKHPCLKKTSDLHLELSIDPSRWPFLSLSFDKVSTMANHSL